MKDCVKKCLGQMIISCQAYSDTPFYGPDNIRRFVECAVMGGAKAVRCCWGRDIKAGRAVSKDLIIIGITKKGTTEDGDRNEPFITPDLAAVDEIVEAGANIVAFDARLTQKRGKESLLKLLEDIQRKYPEIALMADCSTYEEALFAAESGYVDIVSTTLSGIYGTVKGVDDALVRRLKATVKIPVNAEGRVWELADIDKLYQAGADMITVGSAVTRPHLIVKHFVDHCRQVYGE